MDAMQGRFGPPPIETRVINITWQAGWWSLRTCFRRQGVAEWGRMEAYDHLTWGELQDVLDAVGGSDVPVHP